MTHTVTLVSDVYVSKAEALTELSTLLGVPINDGDRSNAVLDLAGGVVLSIEVPKFGEDLPLTLDLTARDVDTLEQVTNQLVERVCGGLSWQLRISRS